MPEEHREAAARLSRALDGAGRVVAAGSGGFALHLPATRLADLERLVEVLIAR